MNNAEMLEFYIMLKKSSNADLKRDLRSIGRIKEENLDLAVSLLRKLLTKEGQLEIVNKLVSDDIHENGCVGAIDPAFFLMQPATISELTYLMANNIKGTDLYTLWNDCSKRNTKRFILNIWALQSGVYKQSEIDENFRINHIKTDMRGNIVDDKDREWSDKYGRMSVSPFIYDDKIINPNDYMKDLLKADDPNGENFKDYVKANRAYQRLHFYLMFSGLDVKVVKVTNKNEITVSMVLPTYQYDKWRGWSWRQIGGELETFEIDTNKLLEIIVDRPVNKHYDMMNRFDINKAIHYLRHSKKQFLPGLSIIRSLPLENVENFYVNNNHKRYGELIKLGQYEKYHDQEGFVKLAFVLGLFSKSETDSQIASDYLKQHVIGKISGDDIHKLYGTLNLERGFDKDFAQFFMIHHSKNPHCFETTEGVDRTDGIYANFDKILAFRPEKGIKTTTNRERLTPEDALSSLNDSCMLLGLPKEYTQYVKTIGKYSSNKDEILWAVENLKEGEKIPEDQIKIPYIEDEANALCKFRVLKKGDPEIAITGRKTNCCFRYSGGAHNALLHAMTSPNSTVVVFESEKGYTQGWVWYDENDGILVIDNLEGMPERNQDDMSISDGLMQAVIRYADQTMLALKQKGLPCTSINLGVRGLNNCIKNSLKKYEKLGFICKSTNPNINYIKNNKLYTDAHKQYILTDMDLIRKHSTNKNTGKFESTKEDVENTK